MTQWLNMGGYAGYVWPSYVLTLAVVALNVYWARRSLQRARSAARRRLAMRGQA